MVLSEQAAGRPAPPSLPADPAPDPTRWITRGLLASAAGATAVVAWVPGVASHLYDAGGECPFRSATGLLCPFCGMTHATVALLRGDLGTTIAEHPFATVYVVGLAAMIRRSFGPTDQPMSIMARHFFVAAAVLFVLFAILRNL